MSKVSSVVIVGRVNVGKSTLFNRLAEHVRSITLDFEGVTRDFIKDQIQWQGIYFDLIDSGGINLRKTQDELTEKIRAKVLHLIENSDLILFMIDGTVGVLPEDREISRFLHKLNKTVILIVNKVDSKQVQEHMHEFSQLGHALTIFISAEHGTGINDLLNSIIELIPKKPTSQEVVKPTSKVVLLGKPNVGKSSLMNLLLKEDRLIVSDIPGTTREAVSESIMFYKEAIEVTDTPGVRRKRSVSGELEPLMVKSSFYALKHADIIVLMIDGSVHALADQELKLAFYAFSDHHKALILLVNKQDLMTDLSKQDLATSFDCYKHLIKKIPVEYISCKTGKNIGHIVPLVHKIWTRYSQQLDSTKLATHFLTALQKTPLYHSSKLLKLYRVKQIKTAPITIHLGVNEPDWFGPSQLSFFENILRAEYDLIGVPVKFIVRKGKSID
jgi:GTPase